VAVVGARVVADVANATWVRATAVGPWAAGGKISLSEAMSAATVTRSEPNAVG